MDFLVHYPVLTMSPESRRRGSHLTDRAALKRLAHATGFYPGKARILNGSLGVSDSP